MAAHRYWRLYFPNAPRYNGGYYGIGEIELASTYGGADLTTPSAAVTQSTASDFQVAGTEAAQAFDNVPGSSGSAPFHVWQGNLGTGGAGSWIKYDFLTPTDIVEFRIYPDDFNLNRTIEMFFMQSSDDGSTWKEEWCSFTTWPSAVWQTFAKPSFAGATAKYWGIRGDKTVDVAGFGAFAASTIEMHATAGGADVTTGGTGGISSYTFGALSPAAAYDADAVSFWASYDPNSCVIGYNFASPLTLTEAKWIARNDSTYYRQSVTEGYPLKSNDGISWLCGTKFSGLTYSGALGSAIIPFTFAGAVVAGPVRRRFAGVS